MLIWSRLNTKTVDIHDPTQPNPQTTQQNNQQHQRRLYLQQQLTTSSTGNHQATLQQNTQSTSRSLEEAIDNIIDLAFMDTQQDPPPNTRDRQNSNASDSESNISFYSVMEYETTRRTKRSRTEAELENSQSSLTNKRHRSQTPNTHLLLPTIEDSSLLDSPIHQQYNTATHILIDKYINDPTIVNPLIKPFANSLRKKINRIGFSSDIDRTFCDICFRPFSGTNGLKIHKRSDQKPYCLNTARLRYLILSKTNVEYQRHYKVINATTEEDEQHLIEVATHYE